MRAAAVPRGPSTVPMLFSIGEESGCQISKSEGAARRGGLRLSACCPSRAVQQALQQGRRVAVGL